MLVISQKDCNISEIASELASGHTLVYPTETCYGLGCDATNALSVEQVFRIKARQAGKPVLVIMADIAMAMKYIEWNQAIETLAEKYWPGALTIVAQPKPDAGFAPDVVGPEGMVAFRVTSHPFAQAVCSALGRPLVSTSANVGGEKSPYDSKEVIAAFQSREYRPDVIIDAGELPERPPSTIVRVANGIIEVLRQGEIVVE